MKSNGTDTGLFIGSRAVLITLLVFAFSLWALDPSELLSFVRFLTFQVRDLQRGYLLAEGRPIFYGPETTGGGHLPGPLYYLLIAIPSIFKQDWYLILVLEVLLAALAATIGWLFFFRRVSTAASLVWLGLFVLSPTLENFHGTFLNVSFQTAFVVAMVVAICEAYGPGPVRARERALAWSFLLGGLTVQLHYSALALTAAIVILQIFARRLGLPHFRWRVFLRSALIMALPLAPYLAWCLAQTMGFNFGQPPSALAGKTADALPTMFSFGALPPLDRVLHALDFLYVSVPIALSVLAPVYLLKWLVPEEKKPGVDFDRGDSGTPYIIPVLVCLFCGLVPALYVFVAPIGYRYGMSFTLPAIGLTALLFDRLRSDRDQFLFTFFAVAGALAIATYDFNNNAWETLNWGLYSRHWVVVVALCIAGFGLRHRLNRPVVPLLAFPGLLLVSCAQNPSMWTGDLANHEMALPAVNQWRRVATFACLRGGWSGEEAADRIYVIGGHMEMDPRPVFKAAFPTCPYRYNSTDHQPDGFLVTFKPYLKGTTFEEFVQSQPVAQELKDGLRTRGIVVEPAQEFHTLIVHPYRVVDRKTYPLNFHNIGLGYSRSKKQDYLIKTANPDGLSRVKKGYVVSWRDCDLYNSYCLSGALIRVNRKSGKTAFDISVLGDSMSQNSPWITPAWNLAWKRPFLEVHCGKKVIRHELAKSIGYDRDYGFLAEHYDFYMGNQSLLTPLRRLIEADCEATGFAFGRESATVDFIQGTKELPARRQYVSL